MTLSAIHNRLREAVFAGDVVCDIGGYDFVSYSQRELGEVSSRVRCL